MSIIDQLRAVGGRLGILHIEQPKTASTPTKVVTRVVSLAELESEVATAGGALQARQRAEMTRDFKGICAAAGVPEPKHGWTIERLEHELRQPAIAALDRPSAQAAILEALRSAGVPVEDVVRDAVARDQALDAYASELRGQLAKRGRARTERRAEIAQEIERLTAESEQLEKSHAGEREHWLAWWTLKHENEVAMAWALGHLLDQPLVSVDSIPPPIDG